MATEQLVELEGLTDEQLFNEANADEAPADTAVAEPAGEPAEQPGQPRDEAGRFAGKPENEPAAPLVTDQQARPQADDNAALVPSWRVREINEEKRAALAELETLRAERAQWQQRQPKPEAKPAERPAKPDPLLDPDGYADWVETRAQERYLSERREDSLQRARESNPKEFDEAYDAAAKVFDPALAARMRASRDPGKTLIEWHREQKTRAEVGTDLTAFRQREEERLLSDPSFLAKAIEKARGTAQPTGNGKPAPVSLPPSLTRATNAAAHASADDDDVSDDGLWRHANA